MGGIGRCCCAECDCLAVEDLPTVTISGYTGGGWTGNCCFEQVFTPNVTPSWLQSCSDMIYESGVVEQCITEHYRALANDYPGFVVQDEGNPTGCEDAPEDWCCPIGFEKIATTTTDWTFTDNAFMAVWRRVKEIRVRISQEDVNCDGVEGETGGCKIVIRSRIVYEYSASYYQNALGTYAQGVVLHNQDCFEIDQNYVIEADTQSAVTCSDVPSNPLNGGNCLQSGTFYFDRVRYYDDMPTGSITFGNTQIPGCTASGCDYEPYNYASSVCIYSPESPIVSAFGCNLNEPCYCTDTVFASNNTIEYGPVVCGDLFGLVQYGCNDDPCELCTALLNNCEGTGGYECPESTWSTACLQYGIDPENPATCFNNGIGAGLNNACACYSTQTGNFQPTLPFIKTSNCEDPENCNVDCCLSIDVGCPCCYPNGVCKDIHDLRYQFGTTTSHTRTQTCSGFESKSVCTSAPSWTITLA